ncbi:hypothetical protein Gste01_01245 [Geobacillus stearothermophilus ATCC 7953]
MGTIPAPIALYLDEQVHRLMENRQIPYFSCPFVVDRGSGKSTMRAALLGLCFLYMNRITIGMKFLFITFNSGNPSDIESTYETSLMFISPLTLLPGSRQCFLFFVTKSQNLVMNQFLNI